MGLNFLNVFLLSKCRLSFQIHDEKTIRPYDLPCDEALKLIESMDRSESDRKISSIYLKYAAYLRGYGKTGTLFISETMYLHTLRNFQNLLDCTQNGGNCEKVSRCIESINPNFVMRRVKESPDNSKLPLGD